MNASAEPATYRASDLVAFARRLFAAIGCDGDKPQVIADYLVEADLMGHTTHGLQLAAGYLGEIEAGAMKTTGAPAVVADRGGAVTWDGNTLPGVWLTVRAIDLGIERARAHGACTIAIRRSHHIACLATFLPRATDQGMMVMIASSDPADASIAPFGGLRAVFTPDPIAVGIPTDGEPILIDMSASITTNGMTNRLRKEGRRYPSKWAMTSEGEPTDDPNTLFTDPPGTILPSGGRDHGHKGYGLALTIEALTQALAGHGRSDKPTGWGAGVFIQVFDPAAFGGRDAFTRETGWIADACRSNPPAPGVSAVRLPGQQALANKRSALANGVPLYPGIMEALKPWAEKFNVTPPPPIAR
jgi:LDH2 family malate/lactate/ureidoglycolate dehydrogenase